MNKESAKKIHGKLVKQKKTKIQKAKELRKQKLKMIQKKANESNE